MMELPRPLDPVRSIKVKLGIVVVLAGAVGLSYFWYQIGWIPYTTSTIAIGLALLTSQLLAHGMTSPLREMTAAAQAMARGDYTRRVRSTSRDEVGELATAFNLMAADLAAADRQRRELIANVSHELRTPISALQAVLENLVDGVSAAEPNTLRAALAQTERLGRLVTELLDLSRIDAGVVPLDRAEFAVGPFLDEAAEEAAMTAAGAGRDVTFQAAVRPAELRGYGDRERLHQVLANLLDNAARHSPPGGAITVTAAGVVDGVVVEVTDHGPGIPDAERGRIFDRFTRGERSGTDGGTGLGLAIAHWVVELHGGSIGIVDAPQSPPAAGCRIRLTLPPPP
ncbi:MAG TPA: ATP-binding protein [Micromonosporaceae bacterium]|jgi:signal transduction histidine kinase|nr:ATP-binding protein [Micromonosporaceae bacterium]